MKPSEEFRGRPGESAFAAAIDRLWERFLPEIRERVAILENAVAAAAAGRLDSAECVAASSAAHKLAGVLGTFGLTHATVLARELEVVYARTDGPDKAAIKHLSEIASELRSMIETRK